ncbi:Cof-type HAD-IIB family hydrolase [Clostridium oceanicum]|uniref:Cof-type HAD-IIB family hydrolase n=1 Tax=Clostridium oceanicum TaxID=1543 RepID=A0ABP3UJW3_9CLOT
MVRAIFFDIDGTLLSFRTHKMAKSTIEALNTLRDKGIKLFVATGRHKSEATILDKYFSFDGYVTLNGQYCFDSEKIIYKKSINKKDIEKVVEQTKKKLYSCYFVDENELFVSHINDEVKSICDLVNVNIPKVCDSSIALDKDIYQLVVFLKKENENILFDATKELDGTRWHDAFMDVVPKGGSKKVGINKLLNHYKISSDEIMAFGDGGNDIPMLELAGIGVAMGNAKDEVKNIADYTTTDVDNDGIMNALKYFKVI